MKAAHDRGLRAVRRVRAARESDSRVGVMRALAAVRDREAEAEQARARLAGVPAFSIGGAAAFRAHAELLRTLAEVAARKEEQLRVSRTVAVEAQRRWAGDRQAVRTVDLLLERRAEERRQARARHEVADLDDLAAQGWLRRSAGPTPLRGATS